MFSLLLSVLLSLAAPQGTGVLRGTVERSGGSDPIDAVEITLISRSNSTRVRAYSDAQGRFVFENLQPGDYSVLASREGYFSYPRGLPLPGPAMSVPVQPGQTRQIVIKLVQGAAIAGRITDTGGRPLQGVQVSAAKLQYDEGRPAFSVGALPTPTNDRGEYRLFWLPPGDYYIRAEYPSGQDNLARKSYYPGTLDTGAAIPLTVRGGESMDGMNFSLPAVSSIRISGEVAFDGPGPATGAVRTFYLLPRDGRPIEVRPPEFTNTIEPQLNRELSRNFSFEVRGIPAGFYDLAPFYIESDTTYRTGRTRIEVADRDIESLIAVIGPNVDVTGRFVVEGTDTRSAWNGIRLQLRAKDEAIPLMGRSRPATVAGDGTFVIYGVPEGVYQIYVGLDARSASDFYVSGMRQGALDIRNEGAIDVRASMLPLEIALSSGAGSVRGVVEAAVGNANPGAEVVLVPDALRRSNFMFYDRTTADSKGQFSFEGIAPGEYKVFAFDQLPDTAEWNAAFIARYDTLGIPVKVNSRSTTEVRVRTLAE